MGKLEQTETLYELILMLSPDIDNIQESKIISKINKATHIKLLDNWGTKKIFPGLVKGKYIYILFEADTDEEINQICNKDKAILRYTIVKKER